MADKEPCPHDTKEIVSREVSYFGYSADDAQFTNGRWRVKAQFDTVAWSDDTSEVSQWLVCKDCGWVISRNPKITWARSNREDW